MPTSLQRAPDPTDLVLLAVLWRLRYKLSFRDVAELLLQRGFGVTQETIRVWEFCFAPLLADQLRSKHRGSTLSQLVTTATRLRPADPTTVLGTTQLALRELARRVQRLEAELKQLDAVLQPLVATTAPDLVAARGVGTDTGGALRGCLRPPLRRRPHRRLLGPYHPQTTRPRWRSRRQSGLLEDRHGPHGG